MENSEEQLKYLKNETSVSDGYLVKRIVVALSEPLSDTNKAAIPYVQDRKFTTLKVDDKGLIKDESYDQLVDYLKDTQSLTVVITTGSIGMHLVPEIASQANIFKFLIYCGDEVKHRAWAKKYSKVFKVSQIWDQIIEELKNLIPPTM